MYMYKMYKLLEKAEIGYLANEKLKHKTGCPMHMQQYHDAHKHSYSNTAKNSATYYIDGL